MRISMSASVMPNTGHRYFLLPVDQIQRNLDVSPDEPQGDPTQPCRAIAELASRDEMDWQLVLGRPWCRWRIGKFGGIDGICLCIESNAGNRTRRMAEWATRATGSQESSQDGSGIETPYLYANADQIPAAPKKFSIPMTKAIFEGIGTQSSDATNWMEPVELKVLLHTIRPNGKDLAVDLIIDFGNTRTLALLLETDDRDFAKRCQIVRFLPRSTEFPIDARAAHRSRETTLDPWAVADSWVVLHEPVFAGLEIGGRNPVIYDRYGTAKEKATPPSWLLQYFQRYCPRFLQQANLTSTVPPNTGFLAQQFVEASPCIIGGGRSGADSAWAVIRNRNLDLMGNCFLSSPKRYVCDGDLVGVGGDMYWNVLLNYWNSLRKETHSIPRLQGPIMMFMDSDGRPWSLDQGLPPHERKDITSRPHFDAPPTHPRRDAMTWAAISILETAYRQMYSEGARTGELQHLRRFLRRICVTRPSGWTTQEVEAYRQQWQKAIDIFTLMHLDNRNSIRQGGQRPELVMDLDEAVAGQLPFIHNLGRSLGDAGRFFELAGRGQGTDACCRVMSCDFGGGTIDFSIVEYRDKMVGTGVDLEATVLFKNSTAVAGDSLVKRIIERVFLPGLARRLSNDDEREGFWKFFSDPLWYRTRREKNFSAKLSRIVHLVFVPIVNHFLSQANHSQATSGGTAFSCDEMRAVDGDRVVDLGVLRELNELAIRSVGVPVLPSDMPIEISASAIRECVEREFGGMIQKLSQLCSAFRCDLVFVSGKPSELEDLQTMIRDEMPMIPNRLLFAKGFAVDETYSVGAIDGRIVDAKTVTVVGAALYQEMTRGGSIGDWSLRTKQSPHFCSRNYWGRIPRDTGSTFEDNIFLTPEQDSQEVTLQLGDSLGKTMLIAQGLNPDRVYLLCWRLGKDRERGGVAKVKIKRVSSPKDVHSESLELVSVTGEDSSQEAISLDDIELRLCTLPAEGFWMDNPRFDLPRSH